jgi:hypothetical protein
LHPASYARAGEEHVRSENMKIMRHCTAKLSVVWLCILSVGCATDQLSLQGREDWASRRIAELRAFTPTKETVAVPTQIDERNATVEAHERFVRLQNGEWISFASCSSHGGPAVDVVLAIDHRGWLYGANGHVCPTLGLVLPKGGTLHTSDDFFATRVVDSNDRWKMKGWHLIEQRDETSEQSPTGDSLEVAPEE